MATLADLASDLTAFVTTPMDATGITWSEVAEALTDDFRIVAGEARAQIIASMASEGGADSNANYLEADVVIKLAYSATTVALQTTWVDTHLDAIMRVLTDRSGWRGLASVFDLLGGPESGIPEKVGNVVFVEVAARVQLVPE